MITDPATGEFAWIPAKVVRVSRADQQTELELIGFYYDALPEERLIPASRRGAPAPHSPETPKFDRRITVKSQNVYSATVGDYTTGSTVQVRGMLDALNGPEASIRLLDARDRDRIVKGVLGDSRQVRSDHLGRH